MIQKSKLSISVQDAQFSKDYQYLITAMFQQQKKQTDVSALARSPIFTNNTLIFDLLSTHTVQGFVIFVAQMVLPSEETSKQSTRTLGECSLDLSPFALQPVQTYNLPIRQQLKFVRSSQGKEITVGRFIASIKIVRQDALPNYMEDIQIKRLQRNQYFAQLPPFDPKFEFDWRVKVQIRQAINIPYTDGLPAQLKVETGWTEYQQSVPEQNRLFSSAILPGPHPEWNQTILITNPSHINEPRGFVMISLKDENNLEDVFRLYVPITSMGIFVPYNLQLIKQSQQSPVHVSFYISLMLETPINNRDQLVDIVVQDIAFEPNKTPFKQVGLAIVNNNDNEPKLAFHKFNPNEDSIERVFEFDQAQQFNFMLTSLMRVPPIKSGNYKAASVFTMSQTLLKRRTNLFLIEKSQKGVYKVVGLSQNIQKDLIALLLQKTKKKLFLAVRNIHSSKFGSCQVQIIGPQSLQLSIASSQVSVVRGQETASEKLMKELNFSNNQSMFKHCAQNNDIIARILRQLDDKSQSLRQAAAEISNLRGRVKLLQNQNGILRQQALRQEDELVNLVQREVENMSMRDLKQKIVKISQLYKMEKIKNRDLDRTVKTMEPQISNTMQLNSVIAAQKNNIQILNQKIQRMIKQHERINVYKDTIKKQEKVIVKLETVMKEGMDQVRNARKMKLQLQDLKKKHNFVGGKISRTQQKDQIQRLQGIIAQLQVNNKGNSRVSKESQSSYQLEFKLHQAETRIASLENELQDKARSYARELAMMKMKVAEKQAMMDGYRN